MQLEFNRRGYRDKDGYSLKTDGKLGKKTRGVYEQYIKDNKKDYDEVIERKNASSKSYSSPIDNNNDFTEMTTFMDDGGGLSSQASMGTIANDLAFRSQLSGAIKPYKVTVNFETRRKI